jgi:hypothetical protein
MKGIAQILANHYQVTVLDWLGFGESECPSVDYNPILFQQLLQDFVKFIWFYQTCDVKPINKMDKYISVK